MSNRRRKAMQIGQVSKAAGVSIDTVRFYERSRLLRQPLRTQGGFRLYSQGDLSALRFIRGLQALGFSLNEIREFVSLRMNNFQACSKVRSMLNQKLSEVRTKRMVLAKLEHELKGVLRECRSQMRTRRSRGACPVLRVLEDPEN